MTTIIKTKKSVAVNPLKQSPPLGAALAFLGLKGIVPLFHGSQGCTAFAKVILVRHFREAIPLATTAMSEVSTILGGDDNVEQAILTLVENAQPDLIGLLTTGLTETRGDDMQGILKSIRQQHPELDSLAIIFVSTPDYKGGLQEGFAAAVQAIVATDYGTPIETVPETGQKQVTILAGSLLAPGDVEEIKEIIQAFGLIPLVIPDLSGSLDGHLDDDYNSKTPGGTSLQHLQQLGRSHFTIAIGESMRPAAETLQQRFGTKYEILPSLVGLSAVDKFLWLLAQIATQDEQIPSPIPAKYQRQRRQLQDAILDTHFYIGGKKISVALEPDLLYQTSQLLYEMGAEIQAAVTTTKSPLLEKLPIDHVIIGDLEDLEELAKGSDLIITNSQGKSLAKKLHVPLYRMGYPIYDRLGNGFRRLVGYRGTMKFLFDLGNIFIDSGH
ncbi:MAG: nitrogenase iron-molybdenum cofactor biosynthesis protein NifN [Chroococcales cyanobacterium]